jgi:hypothetical protein
MLECGDGTRSGQEQEISTVKLPAGRQHLPSRLVALGAIARYGCSEAT